MKKLQQPDIHQLNAAVGWLELGNPAEALEELRRISPQSRDIPEILEVEWMIQAEKGDWVAALEVARQLLEISPDNPTSWIHHSYALHELNETERARQALMPALDKFPQVVTIPYNLACYACQLGNRDEARMWLGRALELNSKDQVKAMALQDKDLKPMWDFISGM